MMKVFDCALKQWREPTEEEIKDTETVGNLPEQDLGIIPDAEPSMEERLDALETTTDDMILLMADLIGGN